MLVVMSFNRYWLHEIELFLVNGVLCLTCPCFVEISHGSQDMETGPMQHIMRCMTSHWDYQSSTKGLRCSRKVHTVKGSSSSLLGPGFWGSSPGVAESAGLTPAAFLRPSSCASNLDLCSKGSVSSENALASSLPASNTMMLNWAEQHIASEALTFRIWHAKLLPRLATACRCNVVSWTTQKSWLRGSNARSSIASREVKHVGSLKHFLIWSVKEVDYLPAMKSSNLSTRPGLLLWALASGETSTGWSKTKVGCCRLCSTTVSKHRFTISPTLPAFARPEKAVSFSDTSGCFFKASSAAFLASPVSVIEAKSTPAFKRDKEASVLPLNPTKLALCLPESNFSEQVGTEEDKISSITLRSFSAQSWWHEKKDTCRS